MNFIDNFLNRITMYRLMLYYLTGLLLAAMLFGALGLLPYSPLSIFVSVVITTGACWLVNQFFAKIFRIPTNIESVYITAFILALIISPIKLIPFDLGGFAFLIAASVFAMASKYILTIHKKHIFNPAAIAVVITAFAFGQYASWWVGGNLALLAFVVVGGLLITRKLQHFDLVLTFFAVGIASCVATNLPFDPLLIAQKALLHTTMLFFGFVMLTEPLTTPPTRPLRIVYGALIGALFSPLIHIGSIYSTPELILVVGNVFAYIVSPKRKYALELKSRTLIGADTYDFAFVNGPTKFEPGQYMEFTLPLSKSSGTDSRGNRRYFTIASSPAEPELHLGVKFHDGGANHGSSSFKKEMLTLQPGDRMMAGGLAGDFTLPRGFADDADSQKKLVFIAGGIGITPFRSMIKYLSDQRIKRDLVLLYSNRTAEEISYREIFDEAARTIGLKTFYINTNLDGRIDAGFIERTIPDWRTRIFYISGPRGMVDAFTKTLHELGVPRTHIKTDFFPGFV